VEPHVVKGGNVLYMETAGWERSVWRRVSRDDIWFLGFSGPGDTRSGGLGIKDSGGIWGMSRRKGTSINRSTMMRLSDRLCAMVRDVAEWI